MLSRVISDVEEAKCTYAIKDRQDTQIQKKQWDLKFKQTILNNSNFELTVMDSLGMRITIPRVKERHGKKGLSVIREYKFRHELTANVRAFFDEITLVDGEILNALKQKFQDSNAFSYGGFGNENSINYHFGHSFSVTFFYADDEISKHGSIYCKTTGLVISKQYRSIMAINPEYGKTVGFGYDPLGEHMEIHVKAYRVMVNKPQVVREKYYFTLGEDVIPADVVNIDAKEPGIYVMEYKQDLSNRVVKEREIKYVKFEQVTNKNGIFTNREDAMLSLNPERSQRARDAAMRERAHELDNLKMDNERLKIANDRERLVADRVRSDLESRNLTLKIHLQKAEEQVLFTKQENEVLRQTIAKQQHAFTIIELERTSEVARLKHNNTITELMNVREVEDKKHEYRIADHEMKRVEHNNKMFENAQEARMSLLRHNIELSSLSASAHAQQKSTERKGFEESFKFANTLGGLLNTAVKLIR